MLNLSRYKADCSYYDIMLFISGSCWWFYISIFLLFHLDSWLIVVLDLSNRALLQIWKCLLYKGYTSETILVINSIPDHSILIFEINQPLYCSQLIYQFKWYKALHGLIGKRKYLFIYHTSLGLLIKAIFYSKSSKKIYFF